MAATFAGCVASPTDRAPPGSLDNRDAFEVQVIQLANQHRAAGATCGDSTLAPVPPLRPDTALRAAARGHSQDMAVNDYIAHTSQDGTAFSQRIRDAGYGGASPLGENIAYRYDTPQGAVDAWMDEPGHCALIMDPDFGDVGVGYHYLAGSRWGHYWTMDFGGG